MERIRFVVFLSDIYQALTAQNIFVRYFSKPERLANFLRITIGSPAQNSKLIKSLKEIIS